MTKLYGKIRYHGEGAKLLVSKVQAAQKQIGKADIYRRQHWTGLTDGYAYFVPDSVYKRTAKQQAWRDKFRQAMLAWNALPESEKKVWRERAAGRPVLGHNLFAQWWLNENKNEGE